MISVTSGLLISIFSKSQLPCYKTIALLIFFFFCFHLSGLCTFIFIISFILFSSGFPCLFCSACLLQVINFRLSPFSIISTYSYKVPCKAYYGCILQMLIRSIYYHSGYNVFYILLWFFFLWPMDYISLQIVETFLDILLLISILILLWSGNLRGWFQFDLNDCIFFYDPNYDLGWWIPYALGKVCVFCGWCV